MTLTNSFPPSDLTLHEWPLPEWAIAYNTDKKLIPGTQLCTKDGRRTGNAHIVGVSTNSSWGLIYHLLTDAGSAMTYIESEILQGFWVGEFLADPKEVLRKFDRQNHYKWLTE